MLGIRYIKVQPTDFILQYRRGKLVREGAGLSFFYFSPNSSLVLIPVASTDIPFIFEGVTIDFQEVTVQGQLTYRVSDARMLSHMLNFSIAANGRDYISEDPLKLPQRLTNEVQVLTRSALKGMNLRQALGGIDDLMNILRTGMQKSELITSLGIEILGLSILAIKPFPETARALEAEAREQILREADEAIYSRRNAAVEQERNIKENELNTEIAVENKKRQIRETQMEAEKSVQQKSHQLEEAKMSTRIALEKMNRDLIELSTGNSRQQSDAKAYGVEVMMKAVQGVDHKVLQALASAGMDSGKLIAQAFREIADSADKIGQLNVSPELLRTLLPPNPNLER
ncbi:MAG: SPFH domain-containing protein [Chloroflexota bacterium]